MTDVIKRDALNAQKTLSGLKVAGSNAAAAAANSVSGNPFHGLPPRATASQRSGSIADYKPVKQLPVSNIVFNVVKYLKESGKSADEEMLYKNAGADVRIDEIYYSLRDNPKINIEGTTAADTRFSYKPQHQIRNAYELSDFVRRQVNGIPKEELEDAYHNVIQDLQTLYKRGEIFILINTDKRQIVYPNADSGLKVNLPESIKTKWKSLHVPNDEDMQKEMVSLGMKTEVDTEDTNQFKKRAPNKKGRKKGSKRIKFYNKHVTDVDITQLHPKGLEARPTGQ